MVDGEVLALKHAVPGALALADLDEHRCYAVLTTFLCNQSQGELRADDRDVGSQLEQKRNRPDVVLVPVGQHQRLDVVKPVFDMAHVRQDQIDTGLVVARKQHTAVDNQQSPRCSKTVMLRPISLMPPSAVTRNRRRSGDLAGEGLHPLLGHPLAHL